MACLQCFSHRTGSFPDMSSFLSRFEGLRGRWLSLSPNVRGSLWVFASSFLFSGMVGIIKYLGQELPPYEIVFFRCFFGVLVLIPFVATGSGRGAFVTDRPKLHLLRASLALLFMVTNFYAVTKLPLAAGVSISFTRPLFMIVLAALFLGERVRWRRSLATVVGFLGVLAMFRPDAGIEPFPAALALFSALVISVLLVVLKKLSATEKPLTSILYFSLLSAIGSAPLAAMVWVTPNLTQIGFLAVMALTATAGQYFAFRGYRIGEATVLAPVDYTQLLFASLIGYWVFTEIPSLWTFFGAGIIMASTLYITYREARLGVTPQKPAAG